MVGFIIGMGYIDDGGDVTWKRLLRHAVVVSSQQFDEKQLFGHTP